MDWMEQEQERGITITSRRHDLLLEGHPHQHHRYPGSRGLHRRSGAFAARAGRRGGRVRRGRTAWSRSRKPFGARRTSTASRASASSTRWTGRARTSEHAVEMIRKRLNATPCPSRSRSAQEDRFQGRDRPGGDEGGRCGKTRPWAPTMWSRKSPRTWRKKAEAYRAQLVEAVAENDDELLDKYLEGENISPEELKRGAARRRPSG